MAESHNTESAPALKPCPFCGGKSIWHTAYLATAEYQQMLCVKCGTRGPGEEVHENGTREEAMQAAISAWNRRSGDRDATIEECAKVADSFPLFGRDLDAVEEDAINAVPERDTAIATAIRALRRAGETT